MILNSFRLWALPSSESLNQERIRGCVDGSCGLGHRAPISLRFRPFCKSTEASELLADAIECRSMHVSDLLNKIAFFEVSPDLASLSAAERQALSHCVRAADLVTEVYLRQVSSDNPMAREQLAARTDSEARDLLTYFELNGGPRLEP